MRKAGKQQGEHETKKAGKEHEEHEKKTDGVRQDDEQEKGQWGWKMRKGVWWMVE